MQSEQHIWESLSPYIRLAHDFNTGIDMQFGPTRCIDHALHYFKQGKGSYIIDGITYPIFAGSVFLIRPGILFSFRADPGQSFHMFNLHFDLWPQADSKLFDLPYALIGDPPRSPQLAALPWESAVYRGLPNVIVLSEPALYEELFHKIFYRFNQSGLIPLMQIKRLFFELLELLIACASENKIQVKSIGSDVDEYLQKTIQFMNEHINETLTLDQLADAACMSKSYFQKCFKRLFILSPMNYLRLQRVKKAKYELTYTRKPIKQIAKECGFENLQQFYRIFRQETGCPPKIYRDKNLT